MTEWVCQFTVYVGITAGNEDKANERMLEVEAMLQLVEPDKRSRKWLGDMEMADMTLEEN